MFHERALVSESCPRPSIMHSGLTWELTQHDCLHLFGSKAASFLFCHYVTPDDHIV